MKSFLEEAAINILEKINDLRTVEIIVPNRRTALFLKKAILTTSAKTTWMPRITTIQEIFNSNSKLIQAEDLLLIYNLYSVFKHHTNTDETFDDFYNWGEIILNDFDDIDKYLVDASKLFSTIKDIKEIDKNFDEYEEKELEIIRRFWTNINQANISIQKEKFLELWDKMFNIYSDFIDTLNDKGIAYQGLIYKTVIQNIHNLNLTKTSYIIIGFNALNKCEKTLFKWLKTHKETYFFWDADLYYLKDNYQEAGKFLRENIKIFPPYNNIGIIDNINTVKRNIDIIAAPSPTSQVKIIPEILDKWMRHQDFDPGKTAIILADESLLIPLMYSIPPQIETYNISMGFPVKNSASASLITHLSLLQQNSRIINHPINSGKNFTRFYYKDVFSIINHSFIKDLFAEESGKIESYILKNKLIYIEASELHVNDFFKILFKCKLTGVNDISGYLLNICSELLVLLAKKEDFITELEFLYKITNRISVLNECINNEKIHFKGNEIYFRLLVNSIKNLSVAFEGEPLEGLQILGFLETRCLDFDRIIMLSLNEGIFPKSSSAQSFIPYNLRKFHELPSIEFQDSIFAYYFYRSIQRAKDIKIIYSSLSGDSSSEVSRFISQIKYELNRSVNIIKFHNNGYKINVNTKLNNYATKTEEVLEILKEHLKNGISPKAINEYLNCQFRYYLNYIKKIKEADKIEEEEDGAFFGRLFHQILQYLYEPYIGKTLNKIDFENIVKPINIEAIVIRSLEKVFNLRSDTEIKKYRNKIIVDIVLRYVYRLLEFDKNNTPLSLIGLEKEYELPFFIDQYNSNIKIKGFIDRVDLQNGCYRVLDYKTGKTESKINNIEQLFTKNRDSKYSTVTQVLLYALMINCDNYVCPGILNVNELNMNYDYRIFINKLPLETFNNNVKSEFEENLKALFLEILNPDIDFIQTENLNNCRYCPYNIICNRN